MKRVYTMTIAVLVGIISMFMHCTHAGLEKQRKST